MPKYRVKTKSFIDNSLREEGEIIEYGGVPGDNLEPMDKAAEDAKSATVMVDVNKESLKRQAEAAAGAEPADLSGGKPLVEESLV